MSDNPVATRTDITVVQKDVGRVPAIGAEAYQHVGRYAGSVVLSVFEQLGGVNRMAAWADSNYTDFATKIFPKIMSRSTQVDVSGSITLDDAISRLEGNTQEPVDAEFSEVQYDL